MNEYMIFFLHWEWLFQICHSSCSLKSGFMMNLISSKDWLFIMLELIKKLIFHATCEKKKKFLCCREWSHRSFLSFFLSHSQSLDFLTLINKNELKNECVDQAAKCDFSVIIDEVLATQFCAHLNHNQVSWLRFSELIKLISFDNFDELY